MADILWQLRYRSPLSPTKGVDDVIIQAGDADEAKRLADWWLANKVASPSTRFVYVRPLVVATMADMLAAALPTANAPVEDEIIGRNPAQSASRDEKTPQPGTAEPNDAGAGVGVGVAGGGTAKAGASKPTVGRVGA